MFLKQLEQRPQRKHSLSSPPSCDITCLLWLSLRVKEALQMWQTNLPPPPSPNALAISSARLCALVRRCLW